MKKIIACLSLVLAMSVSSAMAATYSDGAVATPEAENYKTVLIKNDDTSDIVYVDQAEDVFTAAANFMIKADPASGDYTIYLGRNGSTTTVPFTVPEAVDVPDDQALAAKPVAKSDVADGKYSAGYLFNSVNLTNYNYFAITVYNHDTAETKTGYVEIPSNLQVTANIALTVTNVPEMTTLKNVAVTAALPTGGAE